MLDVLNDIMGGIGSALRTPGDLFRGLLSVPGGGELGSMLSGKELLQQYGLSPPEGIGGDILGMGTEMLTDPLMALGGLGAGYGALKAGGRLRAATGLESDLGAMAGVASKFEDAADAMAAASKGHADDFIGTLQSGLSTTAKPIYDPAVWNELPNALDVEKLGQMADMRGTAMRSGIGPTGMKTYKNYTPDLAQEVGRQGIGSINAANELEMIPQLRRTSKDYSAIPPSMVEMRGSKAGLSSTNPQYAPTIFDEAGVLAGDATPSYNAIFDSPLTGTPPDHMVGANFPELPLEALLRDAGFRTQLQEQGKLAELQKLLDPQNMGLLEELFTRGPSSRLGLAGLGGIGAGGAFGVGSQIFGQ